MSFACKSCSAISCADSRLVTVTFNERTALSNSSNWTFGNFVILASRSSEMWTPLGSSPGQPKPSTPQTAILWFFAKTGGGGALNRSLTIMPAGRHGGESAGG